MPCVNKVYIEYKNDYVSASYDHVVLRVGQTLRFKEWVLIMRRDLKVGFYYHIWLDPNEFIVMRIRDYGIIMLMIYTSLFLNLSILSATEKFKDYLSFDLITICTYVRYNFFIFSCTWILNFFQLKYFKLFQNYYIECDNYSYIKLLVIDSF